MEIKLIHKSGHRFLDIDYNGVRRSVCVDGWVDPSFCPPFCVPNLANGWVPVSNTGSLAFCESSSDIVVVCPTSFGYLSKRGLYRTSGNYHTSLTFSKAGFVQFLYNHN